MTTLRTGTSNEGGQALVEFSMALIPFLLILLGIVDLGRGIYVYNGTAQAAREIARVTVVHPFGGCTGAACELGSSAEAQAVVATQRGLIPGLALDPSADIACVGMSAPGDPEPIVPDDLCRSGSFVRVSVSAPFSPITASLLGVGPFTFSSTSRIEVP